MLRFLSPLILTASLLAGASYADTGEGYCVQAQKVLAGTTLEGALKVHSNYDSFVESKPTSEPLQLHAFRSNPVAGHEGLFKTLSCKMRTSERLNAAYGDEQKTAASGDTSCEVVQRDLLRSVRESLGAEALQSAAVSIVVDAEERTYMGPSWLKGWPFEPAVKDAQGQVHLRTRALYAPNTWWMPLPERFVGNYYCHLVSPGYLAAILLGTVSP